LGLKKMNDVREHNVTPELMGKIALISYLIKVEEVQ
ncbi:MAG: uL30 family ribosomal protein, partial [Cetobacterium sp.]